MSIQSNVTLPRPGARAQVISSDAVLGIVRGLSVEIYPERADAIARLSLDAEFERDFGLDSLGRAELLARIEDSFDVALPDSILNDALSPATLLSALEVTGAGAVPLGAHAAARRSPQSPEHVDRLIARRSRTLVEVLERHAQATPQRVHATFLDEQLRPDDLTYGELLAGARDIADGLWQLGIKRGDSVALMLPSDRTYFETFMGVLLAGGAPVPIYPPVRPSQIESHLRRHARILDNAQTKLLVTLSEGKLVSRILAGHVRSLDGVTTPHELRARSNADFSAVFAPDPNDVALIQYTSGSTGDPKGVVLTHAQLLANIRAMGEAIRISDEDVFVSWLPLYHDMGLIGAWLGSSLCFGARLVLMSPITFLRRPVSWLRALDTYQGTLSAAPNFAYEMAVHRISNEELENIDLKPWRLAFNGAEPVSAHALEAFCTRFSESGFRTEAMTPVFGLAECSLGLTFPPLGRGPVIDHISEDAFARSRQAIATKPGETKTVAVVGCGHPLPGYAVRIVDPRSEELVDRHEGRIQFQGPSATDGYFRNPSATADLFDGGWLDTGDLGYLAEGELFITRRAKDMIIRGGRNLFPYELEEAVGKLDGIRNGCVAVFGSRGASGTERVVVLAEVRDPADAQPESRGARQDAITTSIQHCAVELLGLPADDVVLAPPNSVLKTSSGKIRRSACRERYESGDVGDKPAPVWWQIARLALDGLPGQVGRLTRKIGRLVWGGWALAVTAAIAVTFYVPVVFGPKKTSWAIARTAVRLASALTGCRARVHGTQHLMERAERACLIAVNHASYMDWLVVMAVIPGKFSFVAKAELASHFAIGPLLRKLDTEFVERYDARQSVVDAQRIAQAARNGRTMLIFPEGTFRRAPGLAPFRLGAFQAAVQAGALVVPVCIHGTRAILPGGARLPRPGPLEVTISPAIAPDGHQWIDAIALRDKVRGAVAANLDEPLLTFGIHPTTVHNGS